MKNLEEQPISFESSYGALLVNQNGTLHKDSCLDDWLGTILKVDLEELNFYYELSGLAEWAKDYGDVLDFGYWDMSGKYHKPDKDWRLHTFYNQDYEQDMIEYAVEQSFKWIDDNRGQPSLSTLIIPPKEKAKELVEKMNRVDIGCDEESMCMLYPHAILCASIAVDEIILNGFNPQLPYNYYQEVKTEIEKLKLKL